MPQFDPQQQATDIFALKQRLSGLETETRNLTSQLRNIQNTTPAVVANAPQVENFIRNGDVSHSYDTYFQDPSVADDTRYEAWEIFWHTTPVTGQKLEELSVYNGDLVADSTALPDPSRSDLPTIDPNWNQTAGYIRLGSTNSIDLPLPSNIAFPGRLLYVSFIMARASANVEFAGGVAAGIWDNTAGQRIFLSAAPFSIDADTVGVPASITSSDYLAIGILDNGTTISTVAITRTRPADAAFVSGSVYERISWTPFPGLISVDIYRKTGAVYVKLARVGGGTAQYFDQGTILQTVGAFPEPTGTVQRAYAQTRAGALADLPVDGIAPAWTLVDLLIAVPATYDQSVTTDKQWLRVFLTEAPTGADAVHGIYLDLISMSYNPGAFAHHPSDLLGVRQPIAAPNGSSQGGTGTGGGPFVPPDPGDGGPRCLWETCEVLGVDNRLRVATLTAKSVQKGDLLISPENNTFFTEQVKSVKTSKTPFTLTIKTKLGSIRCSPTEPFKSEKKDILARDLKRGDKILIYDATFDSFEYLPVTSIRRTKSGNVVMITMAGRRKYFMARDIGSVGWTICHNEKIQEPNPV